MVLNWAQQPPAHIPEIFPQSPAFDTAGMLTTAVLTQECENPLATTNLFRVGLAHSLEDLVECQRLRDLVFNCELGEGLEASTRTGLDRDRFDFICDHLMVNDAATGRLVGTYRMQSGYRAKGTSATRARSSSTLPLSKVFARMSSNLAELASVRIIATPQF